MAEFLYLFRGGDAERAALSPEAMQAHMGRWMSWMDGLGKQGKLTGGLPLGAEGKVVAKHGQAITDGPFTEGKEVVGGYLIVKANDLNEATEISKGCPLFEHNGTVEIRPLLSMEQAH
jgi:hypothetical protein